MSVDARVELVAAALCEAEWPHPSVWEGATEARRELYRREARRLLAKLDACAVAHRVDPVTDHDIQAGLGAAQHADTETPHAGGEDETWTARDEEVWAAYLAKVAQFKADLAAHLAASLDTEASLRAILTGDHARGSAFLRDHKEGRSR